MARDGDWDPENPFAEEDPFAGIKWWLPDQPTKDNGWGFTGFTYKGLKIKSSKHSSTGPNLDAISLATKKILPHLLKGMDVQFQDFVPDMYSTNIVAQLYTWVWTLASVEEASDSPYYAVAMYKPFICYACVTLDPHEIPELSDPTVLYSLLKMRLLKGLSTLEKKVHKLKASLKPITGYEYIPSTYDNPVPGGHTVYKTFVVQKPKYGLPNF